MSRELTYNPNRTDQYHPNITGIFPINSKPSNYEKLAKNEEIKLKNCTVRIKKLQIEIKF